MLQSMSRAANCYDNAFMESCFGTFKTELEMTEYDNYGVARREIAEYIDYYRNDRKHSALGYRTPQAIRGPYEQRILRSPPVRQIGSTSVPFSRLGVTRCPAFLFGLVAETV